jgi:hypothetical protein
MPRSAYFQERLEALQKEYSDKFPHTLFPGTFLVQTHITPHTERLKKVNMSFPREYKNTYSGIPALTIMLIRDNARPKDAVHIHLVNLINDEHVALKLPVSDSVLSINRKAMDRLIALVRRHLWRIGRIRCLNHVFD